VKPALPILTAFAAVLALSGCGMANETPCRDFEAAYNEANLSDKLNMTKPSGQEYGPALAQLAATARAGAEKASGDVQKHLWGIVNGHLGYERGMGENAAWDDFLIARGVVDDARDGLVEACKGSGYPIQLESASDR
jgi:hypothetical protein